MRLARGALAMALAISVAGCSTPKSTGLPAGPTPEALRSTVVRATGENSFDPKELTVEAGETVTWEFEAILHNVVFATIDVNSHPECSLASGDRCAAVGFEFEHTFDAAGDFLYYCIIHGTPSGGGMAGTIVVTAAAG